MNDQLDPLERRLQRHLRSVDEVAVPGAGDVNRAVGRVVRRRQVRSRVLVGTASVAVVTVAVVALAQRSPDQGIESVPSAGVSTPRDTAPLATVPPPVVSTQTGSPWIVLPPDPRGVRHSAAVVWTGTEAIAFGGRDGTGAPQPDAAAYSPASATWRVLAGQPRQTSDRANMLVVWTGQRALLIGGTSPTGDEITSYGTAFDPSTDTWSLMASPPIGVITDRSPSAWTGTELVVWPKGADNEVLPIAYDPATDQWRVLPQPPIRSRQQAASVWTGAEWLVWGGRDDAGDLSDGAAYDPVANTWRSVAASPLGARRVRAVWTGSEMLLAAGSSGGDLTGNGEMALADGAAYDPATDTWRSTKSGFAHPGFLPVWTGDFMVMFAKGGAVVYDPAEDAWLDVCCNGTVASDALPLFTGNQILVLGSYDGATGGGGIDLGLLAEISR